MENLKAKIKALSKTYLEEVISIRRTIHQHPELAFQEEQTAQLVAQKLSEYGIEHQTNIAKTGVVGLIKGKNPDKFVIGLRADMDALPIEEANTHDFVSKNKGVMHACGHDFHTSALLGTAKILNELKEEFEGSIKLIFQPSEEEFPGGARVMIEEGVLENPKVDAMIGQHVYPQLPVGHIGMKSNQYMASTDELHFKVKGKGGHAALPEQNIDPILIASHIVVALQQVVSRNASPAIPTVVSIGNFLGKGRTNVIPNEVQMDGILRTFDEDWRMEAQQKIRQIAEGIAQSMGGSCELDIVRGYPVLVNDKELTEQSRAFSQQFLGNSFVHELDFRMTAEDFAFYSQKIPVCFYRVGVRNEEKGITSNLHTPTFDVDEQALESAIGLMSWLTVSHLKSI
ncbi:MAG: N-acyl-L-amino acid amidohydrolase [Bacteroidetes bacterium]|nr:MAG: N-acyl-L-amino acid amidohydrolase [Bacteroidota bacterium]